MDGTGRWGSTGNHNNRGNWQTSGSGNSGYADMSVEDTSPQAMARRFSQIIQEILLGQESNDYSSSNDESAPSAEVLGRLCAGEVTPQPLLGTYSEWSQPHNLAYRTMAPAPYPATREDHENDSVDYAEGDETTALLRALLTTEYANTPLPPPPEWAQQEGALNPRVIFVGGGYAQPFPSPPLMGIFFHPLAFFSLFELPEFADDAAPESTQSEETIHTYWCQQAGLTLDDLDSQWENLKEEDNFDEFATLLVRLTDPLLKNKVSAADVMEVIQSVIASPETRRLIFDESQSAAANCLERPLSLFNTIQGLARFNRLEKQGASPQDLFTLAKGLLKQTLLDEATFLVMTQQWTERRLGGNEDNAGPDTSEALEYQMALRKELETELGLPCPVNPLFATTYVHLTTNDINIARNRVNEVMKSEERLTQALLNQPFWTQYLRRVYAKEFTEIDTNLMDKEDALSKENKARPMPEQVYTDTVNNLLLAHKLTIEALQEQKTVLFVRGNPALTPAPRQTVNYIYTAGASPKR